METKHTEHSEESDRSVEILRGSGLYRTFRIGSQKIEVLKGIDFSMREGEAIFLLGASGAGKTTLLYTLAGLERPEAGKVIFEDVSLFDLPKSRLEILRNQRMGFIFQAYFLLPELTALENVQLPAMIGGKKRTEEAQALLERVGLGNRMHHLPSELSGGEQQRVAIARSLVNNPRILFADEPTGNLDSQTGASIVELLMELVREDGRSLLVVTHDTHLARHGDRTLRIVDGRIAEK